MNRTCFPAFGLLGVLILAPAALADTLYEIQPIVKLGDRVGDLQIKATGGDFEVGKLNDKGHLLLIADNAAGGEMLLRYADGRLTPIASGGREGPVGTWPQNVVFWIAAGMNQAGHVAFGAGRGPGTSAGLGLFLWDDKSQKVTAGAVPGMPAYDDRTFERNGPWLPSINDSSEVAFQAPVKNGRGITKLGIFLLNRDSRVVPIAVPDQKLPDGQTNTDAVIRFINDAGAITFSPRWSDGGSGEYVWENGQIRTVFGHGVAPTGVGFLGSVNSWADSQSRSVLVWTVLGINGLNGPGGPLGLHRFVNGKSIRVAAPNQEMPGGGKLLTVDWVSDPNTAGQHAFIARLNDRSNAVYLMNKDGTLSLVLKTGTDTAMGKITKILGAYGLKGSIGLGLNGRGEIALPVQIDGGVDTIVLLTPTVAE